MNGSPLHVIEGDFYVAKACGQATLDLSSLGKDIGNLTVLNTHFFAPGGDWGEEWKRSHRLAQAWELARLANVAAERGQNVIVVRAFSKHCLYTQAYSSSPAVWRSQFSADIACHEPPSLAWQAFRFLGSSKSSRLIASPLRHTYSSRSGGSQWHNM